jgi:hypothetical protein
MIEIIQNIIVVGLIGWLILACWLANEDRNNDR